MTPDAALSELFQAPLEQFIAERKRLAGELKAAGDAAAAKELATRAKPPISAWVTNQLWWHARDAFDELLAAADKLRKGQLAASAEHREALGKLRKRAAAMLEQAGHGATEATLRRVTTTLSAIAATGSWDPDQPGTLSADRDPPGFEAVGIPSEPIERPEPKKHEPKPAKHDKDDKPSKDELEEMRERKRAEEQAEKKRAEEEKKRIASEKHRIEGALRTAKAELHDRERDVKQAEKQLHAATEKVNDAQELVDELQQKLDELRGS